MRHFTFVAAVLALLVCGVRAQAAQVVPPPSAYTHAGVTIVTQPDAASSLTGVALFVRAGLDRQSLKQDGLAALTAQTILDTPTDGVPLRAAVAALGGSISFAVEGGDTRFYLEGLSANVPAMVTAFEHALGAPDFSPATVSAARDELNGKIARNQHIALQVGVEMLNRQFFGDSNVGLPQYGTPRSLAQYVPADARAFYARTYRRGGAVISAVGALTSLPSGTLEGLAETLQAGSSARVAVKVAQLHGTSREVRTHRDVSAPWLVAQYPAPAIGSKDFASMLVVAAFIDRALADIAQIPSIVSQTAADRAVGTIYNFDQRPANLIVYLDGGLGDPTRSFEGALSLIDLMGSTKLNGSIEPFKLAAQGDYVNGASTLADRAWIAGVFAMDNGSPDYLNRTLAAISAVTPADMQRVAKKYLAHPTVALVLPRSND